MASPANANIIHSPDFIPWVEIWRHFFDQILKLVLHRSRSLSNLSEGAERAGETCYFPGLTVVISFPTLFRAKKNSVETRKFRVLPQCPTKGRYRISDGINSGSFVFLEPSVPGRKWMVRIDLPQKPQPWNFWNCASHFYIFVFGICSIQESTDRSLRCTECCLIIIALTMFDILIWIKEGGALCKS